MIGTFSNYHYDANVSFGQDLGTSDYTLMTSLVRGGVYGIFHHVTAKTSTGFAISVGTNQGYYREGFTVEWIAII